MTPPPDHRCEKFDRVAKEFRCRACGARYSANDITTMLHSTEIVEVSFFQTVDSAVSKL